MDGRELGTVERVFAAAHALGGGFQIVGATALEGELPRMVLERALERVRQRHPLLSACIDRGGGRRSCDRSEASQPGFRE